MLASDERLIPGGDVGFATRVGQYVQTVLGLSMTSTSVGWTLLDGQGPDAASLDHDAFDVQFGTNGAEADTSRHAAAARGAQAIAAASGHQVGSVQVTWTEGIEAAGTALLESMAELGFANVHAVSLNRAAQAWGIEIGRENDYAKTGLCILEPNAATVMIVATGAGSVRTAVTDTRETAEDLVEWLRTVFRKDGWLPEALYLVGALADLDAVTQPIADALPIPVSDSVDTQLALARGAALTTTVQLDAASPQPAETPREAPWRVSVPKKTTTAATEETVAALAVAPTESLQAVETRPDLSPREPTRHERPWLVAHAKKLTIGAAAVAVFGAALSLAAGSALNVEIASTQAADSATAADASVPSASVHTVPAPAPALPAPQLQPMAAQPPAVPPPPPPAPLTLPAEPVAVAAPQPVATPHPVAAPVPHPTVTASPTNVPVAAPAAPPPAAPLALPAAPPPAAPVAVPDAPPPVAPFGLPPAPPPAAPFGLPPAPPPAAPAVVPPGQQVAPAPPPAAPAPPPAEDAPPPPPPDPIQVVLAPLFGGLP